MSKGLIKRGNNILDNMNSFIENTGLNDVKTVFDSKKGTATISGSREGIQYTTTMREQKNGVVKTESMFSTNLGKSALTEQIKELSQQGYKQREIADMLGISQSLVSKYLNL